MYILTVFLGLLAADWHLLSGTKPKVNFLSNSMYRAQMNYLQVLYLNFKDD